MGIHEGFHVGVFLSVLTITAEIRSLGLTFDVVALLEPRQCLPTRLSFLGGYVSVVMCSTLRTGRPTHLSLCAPVSHAKVHAYFKFSTVVFGTPRFSPVTDGTPGLGPRTSGKAPCLQRRGTDPTLNVSAHSTVLCVIGTTCV